MLTEKILHISGPPYSEVTGVFCRVPSPRFSRSPWYSLPIHLCRFRVRAAAQLAHEDFLGSIGLPTSETEVSSPSCLRRTGCGFTYTQPYALSPGQPSPGMGYLPASLRSLPNTVLGRRLNLAWTEVLTKSCVLSINCLGRVVVPPVREYQPVVHRLRLSASP